MKKIYLLPLVAVALFTSCKKDDVTNPADTSDITLHFDNIAGAADLALNTANYTNAAGESLTISKFDYYISNIKLKKLDGTDYIVPQNDSYFLIKESDEATQDIDLSNVPVGDYTSINFTVGVDSAKCTADISQRTGVLDPAAGGSGMYWSWNSGYIFVKMEGTSPVSTLADHVIQYHVGGFGGMTSATLNNIRTVTLPFPGNGALVRLNKNPEVHLLADALKVLNGTTNISIATNPMIMFDDASADLANNYKNMFIVDHIHND